MASTDMSLFDVMMEIGGDERAEKLFEEVRWPDGIRCPKCDSDQINDQRARGLRRRMPYKCRWCRKEFSVRTDSIMHGTQLSYAKWALAIYLMMDSPKGISSIQMAKKLGVMQKSAWYLGHRIRELYAEDNQEFEGPVEVDETYVGGKDKNRHWKNRLWNYSLAARTQLMGMKDRATKKVKTGVLPSAHHHGMVQFVNNNVADTINTPVYTDGHAAYQRLASRQHESVNHSDKEYVRDGEVHTNGIESFWAELKRGIMGTYHYISPKHTHRYATEFEGRRNAAADGMGTMDKIKDAMARAPGKRLPRKKLVGRRGHAAPWQPDHNRLVDRTFGDGTYIQREKEIREGAFVTDWRTGLPREDANKRIVTSVRRDGGGQIIALCNDGDDEPWSAEPLYNVIRDIETHAHHYWVQWSDDEETPVEVIEVEGGAQLVTVRDEHVVDLGFLAER